MQEPNIKKLSGEVDSIIFRSEDGRFVVIMLATEGKLVNVVGEMGNIEVGEALTCTGDYEYNNRYGEQFRAKTIERSLPSSANAIRRYLASGIIDSITPPLAKKIVDTFQEDTLKVIENDHEQLMLVDGITKRKAEKIRKEFLNTFAVRSLMEMLNRYGLPSSVSIGAWKLWGEKAKGLITANPYVLCNDEINVSFNKADSIASTLNISATSNDRVTAGIKWVLKENAFAGHTALPKDRLAYSVCELLDIEGSTFEKGLSYELEEENVYSYFKGSREFIMLHDYFQAEDYIARRLSIMSEISYDNKMDFSEVINIAEEENLIEYETKQRQAINLALSKGFLILTGGPGTGKTTTLNAIISLLEQQAKDVMLAAPTGRAAKRLSDLTGHEAKTIHRLLEVTAADEEHLSFVHNENNPLDCDALVIDELSMVDSKLFEHLLRAISISCKLILVGDSNQLPSVGAGNVLHDIIESKVMPVVTLTEIFRQSSQSSIVTNAHKIIAGEHPDLRERDNDFFFMQRLKFPELQQLVVDLCTKRLYDAYGYDCYNNIQVLSPTRMGPAGTVELNKIIQEKLNPPDKKKPEVKNKLYTLRKNDKVMQTKNNYDITWKKEDDNGETEEGAGIFNGEIGIVIGANKVLRTVTVDFDGRIAVYQPEMLENLELAYAITVHKSQGNEFDAVILTVLGCSDKLVYRNLLYTAITRAKKLLIIVGSQGQVYKMIDSNKKTLRYTCLKEMIIEQYE